MEKPHYPSQPEFFWRENTQPFQFLATPGNKISSLEIFNKNIPLPPLFIDCSSSCSLIFFSTSIGISYFSCCRDWLFQGFLLCCRTFAWTKPEEPIKDEPSSEAQLEMSLERQVMHGIKLIRLHLLLTGSKCILGPFKLSTHSKRMGFNF